ncbi:MAG TPA: nucleoside deaminase [Candidatus Acidoferrales bacterium]|nr:nucleoside deaminase [Candidatus Acidoferrales bacterium]
MKAFITADMPVSDELLNAIAHLPTKSLSKVVEDGFFKKLTDREFMRLAFLLAYKGYEEGGSPIGGVIVDNESRKILGKGHNTLVQEGHPYNHGETSAARDAGRQDFSKTTMFTSLSPCGICAALISQLQFQRLVIGDITNFGGNEEMLRQKGVLVDILEIPEGVAFFKKYLGEKPDQHREDAGGVAAVRKARAGQR